MKLVELKCKNCGATLKADPELDEITCKYCQTTFKIDDEVKHVKFDDMEQNGYEFEKGRIRAQQESKSSSPNVSYSQPQKKSNKTLWLVLAWIFLLPFTATYYIAKSDKLDKKIKIIIIVVMWIVFFILGAVSSSQEKEDKKNRIIECYSQEVYDKLDSLIGIDNVDGYFSDTYACDKLNLKNQHYKKIEIEMDGDKLVSIKLDGKDIYNIDPNVDIYDPTTLRIKNKNEENEQLFGKQENNAYYSNEKNIRNFVTDYNSKYSNKVTKVEWTKNHTIAQLYFNDENCKINDHSEKGYIITCEFNNGKAKVSDYDSILKNMIKMVDTNLDDNKIDTEMANAKDNNMKVINISDKITIQYNYLKEAVSIRAADSYIIELILGK